MLAPLALRGVLCSLALGVRCTTKIRAMEDQASAFFSRLFTELLRLGIDLNDGTTFGDLAFAMHPEELFALTAELPDGAGAEVLRAAIESKVKP